MTASEYVKEKGESAPPVTEHEARGDEDVARHLHHGGRVGPPAPPQPQPVDEREDVDEPDDGEGQRVVDATARGGGGRQQPQREDCQQQAGGDGPEDGQPRQPDPQLGLARWRDEPGGRSTT